MTTASQLESLFPTADAIPERYQVGAPIEQREYLVNGALRRWEGPLATVRSPIFLATEQGDQQVVLGSTPLLDAEAALEALDAAVAAYDHGRGLWPTLRVAERIQYVEGFLARMREQRDSVVRLLMWEIGKNLKDSEKEFDRTCDYIVDTIQALKELDRRSSRFELEQGTLGQIRRVPHLLRRRADPPQDRGVGGEVTLQRQHPEARRRSPAARGRRGGVAHHPRTCRSSESGSPEVSMPVIASPRPRDASATACGSL